MLLFSYVRTDCGARTIKKIFRTGHSYCVTIDKKMLKELGWDGLTSLWMEPSKNKKEIILRKKTDSDW